MQQLPRRHDKQRRVLDAANMADIFILNEKERGAITGQEVTMAAVNSIKTRTLVLTPAREG
jgi:sugar/nucleoside kinase (ribokinase family)